MAVSERNAPDLLHHPLPKRTFTGARRPDHKTLFLHNYELYERAKKRGEPFSEFALLALAQIYHISDVPAHADREANVQVMHDLLGPLHTEDEIREKYDQLREDAGMGPRGF